MIFKKPSSRTRVSFEIGMFQLGGWLFLNDHDPGMGVRESVADIGRLFSRYLDGIVIRPSPTRRWRNWRGMLRFR